MSGHDVSETITTSSAAAPPARVPGLADPVPVGIAGFAMTTSALSCTAVLAVFVTLTATYLLVLAELGINTTELTQIGGYVGITCGVAAWYAAFAHVINAAFSRDLIPTWPPA